MRLPPTNSTSRYALSGVSGSGKSHALKEWLARELARGVRVVVFDRLDEYSQHGSKKKARTLGPLRDRVTFAELEKNTKLLDRKDLSLSVVPSKDVNLCAHECDDFLSYVGNTGNIVVVLEEVGRYAFGLDCDEARVAQQAINQIATEGRHDGIALVCVSQRLVHIPKTARSQLSGLEVFLQTDESDLAVLSEMRGPWDGIENEGTPPREPKNREELERRVSSLSVGQSVLWLNPIQRAAVAAGVKNK